MCSPSGVMRQPGMKDETEVETVVRLAAVDVRDLFPNVAPDDAASRVCLLCTRQLKDKTHNLTRHLERHHVGALLQLMEQRGRTPAKALRVKKTVQAKALVRPNDPEKWTAKADQINQAMSRWLVEEQLPLELVNSTEFRAFLHGLNDEYQPPKARDLERLIQSALDERFEGSDDGHSSKARACTTALVAYSRTHEDAPVTQCQSIPCEMPLRGEVLVHLTRSVASVMEAQVVKGQVLGKTGVLGHLGVGIANTVRAVGSATKIREGTRVVFSPYVACEACNSSARSVRECMEKECIGMASPRGTIAEDIVMPLGNVYTVPDSIPDEIALLAYDHAVILRLGAIIKAHRIRRVAILVDGPTMCLCTMLCRYLHRNTCISPASLHVLTFGSRNHGRLSQYAVIRQAEVVAESMPLDQFDGCIDLCASEQSADLATKLIEPTGTLIIVNRARYDLEPQSTMALDVNAIVVRELKVETVAECGDQMEAALAYLVTQCQDTAALAEIQRFVSSCVALANVHEVLEVTPTAQLEAAYLQVTCDLI